MGDCILYGKSGGGTSLNFKVVGGTSAPSSVSRNLISYPYLSTTQTVSGITFTDNGDGTVTANGTASADSYFRVSAKNDDEHNVILQPGTYHLSGCPSGGSSTTYQLELNYSPDNWTTSKWARDFGDGVTFTINTEMKARINLLVWSGASLNSITFKPQLEVGSTATSYVRYDAGENTIWVNTNTSATSWDFSADEPYRRSANKNLIVYPWFHTTKTTNGVTITDNGDGTVTVNGTATADIYFRLHATAADSVYWVELDPGTYTLSDVAGTSNGRCEIVVSYDNRATTSTVAICNNSGKATFTLTKKCHARVALKLHNGKTFSNVIFKPQLEKGSTATSFIKGDATGQVWIPTVNYISPEFNALKKNEIGIYPVSPKQYISTAWTNKYAKIYKNSSWVDLWYGQLIVGSILPYTPFGQTELNVAGHADATAEMSADKGGLYLYVPNKSSSYTKAYLLPKIDVTNYKTLTVTWQAHGYTNAVGFVEEITTSASTTQTFVASATLTNKSATMSAVTTSTVDLSALSGLYTFCATTAGSSSYTGELIITKAVLS